MDVCSYCSNRLAASAAFCPRCGLERPGYGADFHRAEPPVAPDFMQRIPLQGRSGVRMLLAILCVLFAAAPVWITFGDDPERAILLADALMAVAILACAWPERANLVSLFRRFAFRWWPLAVAAAIASPLVAELYTSWMPRELTEGGEDPFSELRPAVAFLAVCVFPGIFEELAFRGVVYGTVVHMVRPFNAHLLTAALFAGIHFSPLIFPYHLLVGLGLGYLRSRTGSLWPPMLAHTAHNAAVIFLYSS